jgi:transglutaminase-like putative cysteine protease
MKAPALLSVLPARPRPTSPPPHLAPVQIGWLGALLLAAQIPQAPHLPVWVALTGFVLVLLRLALLARARPGSPPRRIPSWALVIFAAAAAASLRVSYGYLLGREPSVAFLYILVGIKFLETRTTRDGALLVCLSAFLLITPFFYDQSPVAALAALPALLIVGAVLDALTREPDTVDAMPRWRTALPRSVFVLLQGMPIAVLLFVLFPRLSTPLWGLPADHSAKTGLSDRMSPGQISELSRSADVAFRVDFEGTIPPAHLWYWRGPVLTRFDGRTWSAGPANAGGTMVPYDGRGITYTVTLEPHHQPWLFALDLPAALPRLPSDPDGSAGDSPGIVLTQDQQLLYNVNVTQVLRYTQLSILRDRYPAERLANNDAALRLPGDNVRTKRFASELRAHFPDDEAFIAAILAWFHNEKFVYTLTQVPLADRNTVDAFLFDNRRGFCEHYAAAFVVLLRAAGIPARVVTGYQGGEINPNGGYMIVRQSDAHAWAEALIDGQWRRFDPTAAVAPSRIELGLGGTLAEGEPVPYLARLDVGWVKAVELAWDSINHGWRRNVVGFNRDRQRSLWRDMHLDRIEPWQLAVLIVGAMFAWAGVLTGWLLFRRRRQEPALVLWNDLCRRLQRAGLPRQAHEGPLAFAQRAAARWPQFAIAFAAIGESFAALRYGAPAAAAERSALLATLKRAVAVLPSPRTLRRGRFGPAGTA